MGVQGIDGQRLAELIEPGDVRVIDVRERADYDAGHIPGAVWLPFAGLTERAVREAAPDKAAAVAVYCYVGGRSAALAKALDGLGYERVYNLGGVGAWPFELVCDE